VGGAEENHAKSVKVAGLQEEIATSDLADVKQSVALWMTTFGLAACGVSKPRMYAGRFPT
jgi:NADH:ubiquinone oxidoreductase subunit B-like Fe-S oxidoreductase